MKTARILDADLEIDLRSLFVDQQENINKATECLRVLSHPARLKILCILQQDEHNVQELEYFTGFEAGDAFTAPFFVKTAQRAESKKRRELFLLSNC